MKRCFRCKESKPITQFGQSKANKDGLCSYCFGCSREYQRDYRQTKKGKQVQRAARLKYRSSEKGKLTQERRNERQRSPEYLVKILKRQKEYRQNNLEKVRARGRAYIAVNRAVSRGDLLPVSEQKCNQCDDRATDYHHWSYLPEHWLDVIPLCRSCHKKLHFQQKSISAQEQSEENLTLQETRNDV